MKLVIGNGVGNVAPWSKTHWLYLAMIHEYNITDDNLNLIYIFRR